MSSQRKLAELSGFSLGFVNKAISNLISAEMITSSLEVTEFGESRVANGKTKNAIILAAGYGMRMVPVNMETSKAFLEVNKQPLIERLIEQLHGVGICDITIVVGYMKEQFEYLIDQYDVDLVVNTEYNTKNNLHSLCLVADRIENTYIVPCDIWCDDIYFDEYELHSWYMVSDDIALDSTVKANRNLELVNIDQYGNKMVGIAYVDQRDAIYVIDKLRKYDVENIYRDAFWEAVLYEKGKMVFPAKIVQKDAVIEFNTYEQLRDFDQNSNHLNNDAILIICDALQVDKEEIKDIEVLKKGMTNRSFLFSCQGKKYIMRIPGEGTRTLINREKEYKTYQVIKDYKICDRVIYINPENGYKITEFFENARVCDLNSQSDLVMCMNKLRSFHSMGLKVEHRFDLFGQIEFYEQLRGSVPSAFRDYDATKENVFSLKGYIDLHKSYEVLTHIDAVPDNFLFVKNSNEEESVWLIDWEYAGMQDPHVDIAMFCIYAMYQRKDVDRLIDIYFENTCAIEVRKKIYAYIAVCGLLWSNWCEYKKTLGVDFGEYSIKQYRYAKEYYKIVKDDVYA